MRINILISYLRKCTIIVRGDSGRDDDLPRMETNMAFDKEKWDVPEGRFRVNPMMHKWPSGNRSVLIDAIKEFGFGGVVTNPDQDNWYEGYRESCRAFSQTIAELEKRGLGFWIYDEKGYPSGYAGGETLKGHRELEAKGLYMYRVAAYEDRHFTYHIDDDSDKIVWAASYPLDTPHLHQSYVLWNRMTPVPFSERTLECDMKANTVLFIFNVRPAHIGSQATHNTCSFERYINIMNPDAVRRFIDVAYEPIAEECPQAFPKAAAVFTDEPSLMSIYTRGYESWNFALVPCVDGLFEAYEQEYGKSILPELPLIFEGMHEAFPVRVNFYRLIGKLVRKAYSEQLQAWCVAHGTSFSGHYLCEETMAGHLGSYGSYVDVVGAAGYPGLDVLSCYPEIFDYNTVKHPQIVARKNKTNGVMVELCPFYDVENFAKAPVENMSGVMGVLYMCGVRVSHSYFKASFEEYDPVRLKGCTGYMHKSDALAFNECVGRMGYMLDGLFNDTNTFVCYAIEDTYAKYRPKYIAAGGPESDADCAARSVTRKIFEAGHDFLCADKDDVLEAANGEGFPKISGIEVKTLVVPTVDVMYEETYEALKVLAGRGVKVLFVERIPWFGAARMTGWREGDNKGSTGLLSPNESEYRKDFTPVTESEVLNWLNEADNELRVDADSAMILRSRFIKEGRELWMVDNNTRRDAVVSFAHTRFTEAEIYNPADGTKGVVKAGEKFTIRSFRAVFIWFKK